MGRCRQTLSVRGQHVRRIVDREVGDPDILQGLQAVKQRDGIPLSEQVRRALREWLDENGVRPTRAERKRALTRKRS